MPSKKKKSVVALMKKARSSPAYHHQKLILQLDRLEKLSEEAYDTARKLLKLRLLYNAEEGSDHTLRTHINCAVYHLTSARITLKRIKVK